ncbi:unnamed protein product [Amoebophrya sp. A120]|nr:unnamed protein product [Amoebophrya sp. A120]|eukprot:GSA120T00019978001.1
MATKKPDPPEELSAAKSYAEMKAQAEAQLLGAESRTTANVEMGYPGAECWPDVDWHAVIAAQAGAEAMVHQKDPKSTPSWPTAAESWPSPGDVGMQEEWAPEEHLQAGAADSAAASWRRHWFRGKCGVLEHE